MATKSRFHYRISSSWVYPLRVWSIRFQFGRLGSCRVGSGRLMLETCSSWIGSYKVDTGRAQKDRQLVEIDRLYFLAGSGLIVKILIDLSSTKAGLISNTTFKGKRKQRRFKSTRRRKFNGEIIGLTWSQAEMAALDRGLELMLPAPCGAKIKNKNSYNII